ncbi:hypothetical protein E4T56_gene6600 [Termitomyces sp. T112]|nr:hypothetical protein E4T56_gene6600 [Termitomyces sp. T112]
MMWQLCVTPLWRGGECHCTHVTTAQLINSRSVGRVLSLIHFILQLLSCRVASHKTEPYNGRTSTLSSACSEFFSTQILYLSARIFPEGKG